MADTQFFYLKKCKCDDCKEEKRGNFIKHWGFLVPSGKIGSSALNVLKTEKIICRKKAYQNP